MRGGWFGGAARVSAAQAAVELAVLAAIAEGSLGPALDRLARALGDDPALRDIDWDWLLERCEALKEEAPLFTEARARVVDALGATGRGPVALELAWRAVGPSGTGDAMTLLGDVASRLKVDPPRPSTPLPTLDRAAFDDPENTVELPFHLALGRARGLERRLLIEKLQAARSCLLELGPGARVAELGRHIPRGHALLRADAIIESPDATYTARLLGRGEALHALERRLFPGLVDDLALGHRLLLAHRGPAAPPDRALFDALSPDVAIRLELG